jgi:hypothetical protein
MSTRRLVAPLVVSAAVVGGGVAGAAIGVPAVSDAQESAPEEPSPSAEPEVPRPGRDVFAAAAEALDLEPRALFDQLRDGATIAEIAQERGVDVNAVIDAMVAAAVDGQRSEAEIREHLTSLVNEGGPAGAPRMHRHPGRGEQLDAAATALGIERDDLIAARRDGRTIAEIAEERGVDVSTVVDAMVGEARERIERFVNEG